MTVITAYYIGQLHADMFLSAGENLHEDLINSLDNDFLYNMKIKSIRMSPIDH